MENITLKKFNSYVGGVSFTILLLLMLIVSGIIQGITGTFADRNSMTYTLICSLSSPICLALLSIFISVKYKDDRKEIFSVKKFSIFSLIFALLIGFGMLFGFGVINGIISELFASAGLNVPSANIKMDSGLDFFLHIICFALLPAICEELYFRGIVIKSMDGDSRLSICFLSAFLFAIYHCSVVQFVYQFIYGFILAMLFMYSKSIIPGMIVHFMNNLIVLSLEFFDFSLPLSNFMVIIIGIIIVAIPVIFISIRLLKERREQKVYNIKYEIKPEKNCLRFILPFGIVGMVFTIVIMVTNLFAGV